MNKTTSNVRKDSVSHTGSDDLELSNSLNNQYKDRYPLLPRSGWQNRRAFFTTLIKAKRSLDIAEITYLLESKISIFSDPTSR